MVSGRVAAALSRSRRATWPRAVCSALAVLATVAALVGVIGHYRSPGRGWVLGVSAFSLYLMLGGPLALLLFALARRLLAAVVALLLTAVLIVTQAPLYVAATPAASARPLVVMTANLRLGQADPESVVAAVRRHDVDVLMLEELTPEEVQRLIAAGLDALLPQHAAAPDAAASGTGLWSRYPLGDVHRRTDFSFAFVTARLQLPGVSTPPTLVALHMAGPYPNSTAWHHDIAHAHTVLGELSDNAATIVGGDFNATPDVKQFRALLTGGYRDAAEQSGAGTTRTFPSNRWYPPLIAIDHVLTRNAVATSAATVEIPGSDHRALVSTVAVPRVSG